MKAVWDGSDMCRRHVWDECGNLVVRILQVATSMDVTIEIDEM